MPRATPLPAAERRTVLVQATLPLLQRYGRDVSTRQIAEAAGVAEGTIFRVFPTKEALVDAVIDDAFDVTRTCDALRALAGSGDLEHRLTAAVAVMQERTRQVFALFHTLRLQRDATDHADHRARQQADTARLDAALSQLIEPDAERLRMPPADAAHVLRAVTFALGHPMMSDGRQAEPAQVVELALHGLARREPCSPLHESDVSC